MHYKTKEMLRQTLLAQLAELDGSAGNTALRNAMESALDREIEITDYEEVRDGLIEEDILGRGRGKGGSVFLVDADDTSTDDEFSLEAHEVPQPSPTKPRNTKSVTASRASANQANQVLAYRHDEKRKNNPHVGMVDAESDHDESKTTWAYDPHLAPELHFDSNRSQFERLIDDALASGDQAQMQSALEQLKRMQSPYLNWTGKAERTSFEVDTVSLHVHERIDPATILAAVQKRLKDSKGKNIAQFQPDLYSAPFENLPLRDAIDFYKHDRDWANRLIAGDSLLVMNSLLQKEGMAGQVQMIFIDPPYGIKYGSNFQPFVNKRDVKDRKDEDLTQEPEMIKAFRDTWELGIHSYLTYLRDRLLLSKDLLKTTGSIFVQISDENLHHVRELMDEIFGVENFVCLITFRKTNKALGAKLIGKVADYIVWYSKDKPSMKYHDLFNEKTPEIEVSSFNWLEMGFTGERRRSNSDDLEAFKNKKVDFKYFTPIPLASSGYTPSCTFNFNYRGLSVNNSVGKSWATTSKGVQRVIQVNRISMMGSTPFWVQYIDELSTVLLENIWDDTRGELQKNYVVQTSIKVIERCMLMTTDSADLILDPTCGSGTSAFVAEKWGRRWITCDTSRVAVTLAKQRLMTASYDYYELKYPNEGLRGGFIYKTVPRVALKSIATNSEIDTIFDTMQPAIDQELDKLNQSLKGKSILFTVIEGGRKGEKIDFSAPDSKTTNLPSGETAKNNSLLEWEVPVNFPEDWPKSSQKAFDAFHHARQSMQKQMDASIANNAGQETLFDQPQISKNKLRITGPFTVEAVPFATVLGLDEAERPVDSGMAIARSGETSRQSQWRDELLKTGIRGKNGQMLRLLDLEPVPTMRYIHAMGTVADTGERVVVSFGPEYAALEQRQVEFAKSDAGDLFPTPKIIIFCAFTFDPEAAKDIDSIKGITALKVQMNTDLLTDDLKSKRASNESFWLMGQPDVNVKKNKDGQYQVEVNGFDYFNTKTGELDSGGKKNIAMWALDTNYDNRSLYPAQVFFPMAGAKDGWNRLKKDIRAELNDDLLDKFHGTVSLPFEAGDNRCIAVKIVDDRGIESLKVIRLEQV